MKPHIIFGRQAAMRCLAVMVLVLSACGGDEKDGAPGEPVTIGRAGGVVRGPEGAEVTFPRDALAGDVTVRVAQDGTGAPTLPEVVRAAGPVYSITPHGGDFQAPVTVRIPVTTLPEDASQQLLLLTASPGDTQWKVMSGARIEDNALVTSTLAWGPAMFVDHTAQEGMLNVVAVSDAGKSVAAWLKLPRNANDYVLMSSFLP